MDRQTDRNTPLCYRGGLISDLLTYFKLAAVVSGICVPHCCTIVLVVRDLSSSAEVKVYMNLEGGQYPLGLLPGATVHFETLQRKTSMNGVVYFVFNVASSSHVVNLATGTDRVTLPNRCDFIPILTPRLTFLTPPRTLWYGMVW